MSNVLEIRWHGRGGQGAKTASLLLADVAFNTGKYVQGFPEYGPERMGAPITAYNRISDDPISCLLYTSKKIQEYIQNQLKEDYMADQISIKEYIDPFTGNK